MKIAMMSEKFPMIGITMVLLVALLVILSRDQSRLGSGYQITQNGNQVGLTKNDKNIIPPNIVNYKILSGFFIAFGLPSMEIMCGRKELLIYVDAPQYYILELENVELSIYSKRGDFFQSLNDLGLPEPNEFDYQMLENPFVSRRRLDQEVKYAACLEENGLAGKRVVSAT